MLFGNADVNEVPAEFLAHVRRHADSARSTGVDEDDLFVFGDFFLQVIDRNAVVVFAAEVNGRIAGSNVEGNAPVPGFLVFFRRFVTFAFFGMNMQNRRLVRVFDFFHQRRQFGNVVALFQITVIEPESLKHVALGFSAGLAQQPQVAVQAAVVFGNGHFVVVDNNDNVAVQNRGVVKTFERFAAGKRTVADNRDDVVLFAFEVAGFGQTAGQTDRSGSMPDDKMVVLAFCGSGVAGNLPHSFVGQKTVFAPR